MENRVERLIESSGSVELDDKITFLLYELMLNHITPAKLDDLIRRASGSEKVLYTNGWLAKYASYLADELKNARPAEDFSFDLDAEVNNLLKEVSPEKKVELLEQNIESSVREYCEAVVEEPNLYQVATDTITQLVAKGILSEEEANILRKDVGDIQAQEQDEDMPLEIELDDCLISSYVPQIQAGK